ncbi:ABC transporter substrate-binding protein [Micromonospora sp. CPCC 206061]|uniref:ABC transporter substrate-binding protein n=1 Tax=Micromonospora sp. CPCC 206061 TaxID=3122410 RepID=UPI002FF330DC
MRSSRRAAIVAAAMAALLPVTACGGEGGSGDNTVEVFTWWADGGEKVGLDALVGVFDTRCPAQTFENGAIAGGAGANAKQVLASRLQTGSPPDTFQAHAGAELVDYIAAGQIEDLSSSYDDWGLREAFPPGLIDNLTYEDKIYSVPANIHRANVVWTNKQVLAKAGVTQAPTSMAEFVDALDAVRASGVTAPLAVGTDWTQLMLLETVLITVLGPDEFTGLWSGDTDWRGAEVTKAIADYDRLLGYSNGDRDALDWTDAERMLMNGRAGFQLMGDWEAADLDAMGFRDYYGYFTFPGSGETFQWLADSFTLPRGASNVDGARCWLETVGSSDGQREFNTKKGSIPARTDADPVNYPPYQQSAMADWKTATQVPSCAHGSACSQGMQEAANSAVAKFSTDHDAAALQNALAQAAEQFATS